MRKQMERKNKTMGAFTLGSHPYEFVEIKRERGAVEVELETKTNNM